MFVFQGSDCSLLVRCHRRCHGRFVLGSCLAHVCSLELTISLLELNQGC